MIVSFFIQNFRSILELKLDFRYGEGKAPNGYKKWNTWPFLEAGSTHRLVPCMAFFGANASGKTNILKALSAFKNMLNPEPELARIFEPNLLNPKFPDTTFAIEFFLNNALFEYRLTYNANEILHEKLTKNGHALYGINRMKPDFSQQIHSGTYSDKKLSDILRVECSDGRDRQTKLFLNRIGRYYSGLDNDLNNVFGFISNSLILWVNRDDIPLPMAVDTLARAMGGDEIAALTEITDVVRRLDLDIATIDIAQRELESGEKMPRGTIVTFYQNNGIKHIVKITASHKDISGALMPLDFLNQESAGTQRLAGLVGLVLYVLKTGGVLFVDELECSLHPLLMREIVMLFKRRSHNQRGAQLIVTTHNTDILDDSMLRLSEIALVKKTLANGTQVRRLTDAKKEGEDIRNVTNFRKQYLDGFYSGIPHPAL